MDESARAYYSRGVERHRHSTYSALEFLRIQKFLESYLPPPPTSVLDVGSGSGIWTRHMMAQGYNVVSTDILLEHVKMQQEFSCETHLIVADARSLPFKADHFDAVLLMGPLYHILDVQGRIETLQEAFRVVDSGGIVIATAISRYAMVIQGWMRGYEHEATFTANSMSALADGLHYNDADNVGLFTTAYLHSPLSLRNELEVVGFKNVRVHAVQSFAHFLPNLEDILADELRRSRLLSLIAMVDEDDSLLGATGHLIAVGYR